MEPDGTPTTDEARKLSVEFPSTSASRIRRQPMTFNALAVAVRGMGDWCAAAEAHSSAFIV
jgi:hypothetical protein